MKARSVCSVVHAKDPAHAGLPGDAGWLLNLCEHCARLADYTMHDECCFSWGAAAHAAGPWRTTSELLGSVRSAACEWILHWWCMLAELCLWCGLLASKGDGHIDCVTWKACVGRRPLPPGYGPHATNSCASGGSHAVLLHMLGLLGEHRAHRSP